MTHAEYIKENERRLTDINKEYNPLVGTPYCDAIPRVKLEVSDAPIPVQFIPKEMDAENVVRILRKYGTLARAGSAVYGGVATQRKSLLIWTQFLKKRCLYDFEFWCCYQIRIKQKDKPERGPFILNRAQRYYLSYIEPLRNGGKPIDIILLKARQWGGSTMTQFYMFWIQKLHRKNWNSVICGQLEKQSKVVLSMLENAARDYDTLIDDGEPTVLRPYGRTNSIREIVGRECSITIASSEKPDNVRGEDISMVHLTEIGLWKSTMTKSPEDVIQTLQGSMLQGPYTLFVLESTAKGVGNYFHRTWLDAVAGKNNLTPVFVAWFMIDNYSEDMDDYSSFIDSMSQYEKQLFRLGATLEAIAWYRKKLRSMGNDEARMKSEFPSFAQEAFQSTGNNYFPNEFVDELYNDCEEPLFIGDITGDKERGEESLHNVHLVEESDGNFKVWKKPNNPQANMSNRYLVTVDLGKGHSASADNSVICVFDRYWQHEPTGIPEVVAEWSGHLDMDLIAWKSAQIAQLYDNALLVIEDNSLIMSGIDYFMGVLVEIKDYYPNLYKRTIANKVDPAGKARWGWRTDGASKPRICMNLLKAIRDGMYIERNRLAVDELKVFEEKENGELGAVEGNHDDRVITRAIGVTFMFDANLMPLPATYDPETIKTSYNKTIVNEFSY